VDELGSETTRRDNPTRVVSPPEQTNSGSALQSCEGEHNESPFVTRLGKGASRGRGCRACALVAMHDLLARIGGTHPLGDRIASSTYLEAIAGRDASRHPRAPSSLRSSSIQKSQVRRRRVVCAPNPKRSQGGQQLQRARRDPGEEEEGGLFVFVCGQT
jgi:hypothetical protein